MATGGDTWGGYLAQLNTGIAIGKGTYASGTKILWGDKVMSMGPSGINAITMADLTMLLPFSKKTIVEEEMAWLAARGAPPGTLGDMRYYLVKNNLMP